MVMPTKWVICLRKVGGSINKQKTHEKWPVCSQGLWKLHGHFQLSSANYVYAPPRCKKSVTSVWWDYILHNNLCQYILPTAIALCQSTILLAGIPTFHAVLCFRSTGKWEIISYGAYIAFRMRCLKRAKDTPKGWGNTYLLWGSYSP